ncbi:hypothetical protein [Pontimicrobium sp. IMCC45349]|uniref:hypothetical protein n=1 Tax=Pontimicrobium sp. IMCC45349 TaxID=3391574 RepID=UPI0039A1C4BD
MEPHTDQHLDKLVERVIKSSPLESPSKDFTASIMSKIETASVGTSTVYKPLISKTGWLLIILALVSVSVYMMVGNVSNSWLQSLDYSVITNNKMTEAVSGITFSKSLTYAIVLFGLMFLIQIPLLKNIHNKRLGF